MRPLSLGSRGLAAWCARSTLVLGAVAACTPEIGDKCVLSTDCSIRSDRICDTSQPNGYCTETCAGDGCPDKAACVLFNTSLPGCGFDDRAGPFGSRVARSYCMARCYTDSDCRTEEGYLCADPRSYPWNAIILDDVQDQRTCLVYPSEGLEAGVLDAAPTRPAVCGPEAPEAPPIDAGRAPLVDGGRSADAGRDAGAGIVDAGIADAPSGG